MPTVSLCIRTRSSCSVATILSAQCTDERVNIVTGRMFPKFNKPEHYAALSYGRWRK